MNSHIYLITTTLYPDYPKDKSDRIRGNLAIKSFLKSKKLNLPLIIIDGGSSNTFLLKLKNQKINFQHQKNIGMSSGRRQAFSLAKKQPECKVIIWFEPEKVSFISNYLKDLSQPILKEAADIVLPKRNYKSFSTYPKYQVETEARINSSISSMLKKTFIKLPIDIDQFDFVFGPKVLSNKPAVLNLFLDKYLSKEKSKDLLYCETWSNTLFFPVISAFYKNLKVVSKPVKYTHPKSQTSYELNNPSFNSKRDFQSKTILTSIKQFLLLLENNPSTTLRYSGRFYA